ncbi:hypothetical protein DY000_02037199 [Brassica cretica]|uniref:PPM-type phosphatase domain-containing protein n=1 Tax=Brassica cretica TaxID=69181 RepID=A0ABQ7BHC7_BRACR|nr:hypothetical protein DY000_02037199 [Brassica cretica]
MMAKGIPSWIRMVMKQSLKLGKGGSTAVTGILIDGQKLVVANVGDSRAVMSKNGVAHQLSVDHEPSKERKDKREARLLMIRLSSSFLLVMVMSNKEAVDAIKSIKDPKAAAKHLIEEAISKKSKDDISCIVVKFH